MVVECEIALCSLFFCFLLLVGERSARPIYQILPAGEGLGRCANSGLVKNSQQPADKQDQQYGAEAYASAAGISPTVVAVVSASAAKDQHQNND
jgi:hypothetical protein